MPRLLRVPLPSSSQPLRRKLIAFPVACCVSCDNRCHFQQSSFFFLESTLPSVLCIDDITDKGLRRSRCKPRHNLRQSTSGDQPDSWTPPQEALKAIISLHHSSSHANMFNHAHIDVSRAFFHAEAQRLALVRLPVLSRRQHSVSFTMVPGEVFDD